MTDRFSVRRLSYRLVTMTRPPGGSYVDHAGCARPMTTESTMIAGRAGEPVADPDLIAGTRRRALLRIERHPCGPRLYCAGLRVHHGAAGIAAILTGAALRRRAIVAAGVIALADDWQDFPFNDRTNH